MDDYVSKSDLLNQIESDNSLKNARKLIKLCVQEAPVVDAVPVVRKQVRGYEGYYEVDIFGRVYGIERTIQVKDRKRCYEKTVSGKIMKQSMHTQGYKTVSLTKYGITQTEFVHRIVAEAFIPNPKNLPFVNHKDEDKTNNFVENLEWCSAKYNTNYGTAKKRRIRKIKGILHSNEHKEKISNSLKKYYKTHNSPTKGIISKNRKRVYQFTLEGKFLKSYSSAYIAAESVGHIKGRQNISACCCRKRKSAYGYLWSFFNADGFCSYGTRKDEPYKT
ncbi:MAG: HNH endonuclease [Lachnospiraceae bacterium]|nr:HNH endonuclease [Lachnospiraceae bacterium]